MIIYDKSFIIKCNKFSCDKFFIINIMNFLLWFLMIQNFQQLIFQCVIDVFVSFLRRWISFIKLYNLSYLNIYYNASLMCVFETFNCINQIENW